jgi:DNA helicase II / ATP-dependent DNA helicase PcrA
MPLTPLHEEDGHLKKTVELLNIERSDLNRSVKSLEKRYAEGLKFASQEGKQDDAIEAIKDINNMMYEEDYVFKKRDLDKIRSQIDSPYFARIDFKAKNISSVFSIYIGKHAFLPQDLKYRISDWRSPIASVYYNYTIPTKNAEYTFIVPIQGRPWLKEKKQITGDLKLRRNIEIANSQILGIYDNNLRIDLLKEQLTNKSGGVLEDIVKTIQEEQDIIIRSNPFNLCVVQGTAGSGKTTVAIHRLAYLFYTYPNYITENNTLLLSSSKVLVNYVARTLPELEIYSLSRDTLMGFIKTVFKENGYIFEKSILSSQKHKFSETLNSKEFIEKLKNYAKHKRDGVFNWLRLLDDREKNLQIERYLNRMEGKTPYEVIEIVLETIREYYEDLVNEKNTGNITVDEKVSHMAFVIKKLENKLREYDPIKEYFEFLTLNSDKSRENYGFKKDKIDMDHFSAIYYINHLIRGIKPKDKEFKHVIVDEGQDLGLLNYLAISTFTEGNGVTILGDLNQASSEQGVIKDWSDLKTVWVEGTIDFYHIKVSYRTTKQIIQLARRVLEKFPDFKYLPEAFDRKGNDPIINEFNNREYLINGIKDSIIKIRTTGDNRAIGIIETNSEKLTDTSFLLKKLGIEHVIIDEKFEDFQKDGIYLIPEKLVKGLEFNTVFIIDPNENIFNNNKESAKRLFVCCTRAINNLYIYYIDHINILLKS